MTLERYLRIIAGAFILFSLVMAKIHSFYWLLFTAFIGLNLFSIWVYKLVPHDDYLRENGCLLV